MKPIHTLPLLLALAFLANCASTPQTRIQANPEIYASIPDSQKAKVQTGQIAKGMGYNAVFIAWGRPSGVKSASDDSETWIYAYSYPIYSSGFYYGGYGYGRRCGWGGWVGPVVIGYDTRIYAKVVFKHGRVTYWERLSGIR
ncbi:MAG: hypothetical protein AAF591_06750 [Verrucomicrobiota bacterium]